jgi:hypothetical protein
MREIVRKLSGKLTPSKALPGEAEAQIAAIKDILEAAILRKKNIDPRKLLNWLESGQDFSEVSIEPPQEIPTLTEKIKLQEKDNPIILTDEDIREVSVIAEKRQQLFTAETTVNRIVALRNYTEKVQELVLRVNGYSYPDEFNYWATRPTQDKVLET